MLSESNKLVTFSPSLQPDNSIHPHLPSHPNKPALPSPFEFDCPRIWALAALAAPIYKIITKPRDNSPIFYTRGNYGPTNVDNVEAFCGHDPTPYLKLRYFLRI